LLLKIIWKDLCTYMEGICQLLFGLVTYSLSDYTGTVTFNFHELWGTFIRVDSNLVNTDIARSSTVK